MSGCGCGGRLLKFQKGDKGERGYKGWSPVLQLVEHDGATETPGGGMFSLKFVEWTGGEGAAPSNPANLYLGSGGFVAIGSAYDLKGPQGIQGIAGANGADGADGNGIAGIAWTSNSGGQPQGTQGTTDTYTITYDDATTDTFVVTNGADGADASAFGYDNLGWTTWVLDAADVSFVGTNAAQLTLNSVASNLKYKVFGKTLIISGYAAFNVTGAGGIGFWPASARINITNAIGKTPVSSYFNGAAFLEDISGTVSLTDPQRTVRSEMNDYIIFMGNKPYDNDSEVWPKAATVDYRYTFNLIMEIA